MGRSIADLRCHSARSLSISSYFGWAPEELSAIAGYLSDQQRADGSWRPNDSESASDYEFETTLLVLEALLQFERAHKDSADRIPVVRQRGWRFLLSRRLGLDSGRPLKRKWGVFAFPPYWFYDCLTALDCLRDSQGDRDPGAQDAIDLVRARRRPDGRWGLGGKHPGRTYFEMETASEPSRWNTLRAMRVSNGGC